MFPLQFSSSLNTVSCHSAFNHKADYLRAWWRLVKNAAWPTWEFQLYDVMQFLQQIYFLLPNKRPKG